MFTFQSYKGIVEVTSLLQFNLNSRMNLYMNRKINIHLVLVINAESFRTLKRKVYSQPLLVTRSRKTSHPLGLFYIRIHLYLLFPLAQRYSLSFSWCLPVALILLISCSSRVNCKCSEIGLLHILFLEYKVLLLSDLSIKGIILVIHFIA